MLAQAPEDHVWVDAVTQAEPTGIGHPLLGLRRHVTKDLDPLGITGSRQHEPQASECSNHTSLVK